MASRRGRMSVEVSPAYVDVTETMIRLKSQLKDYTSYTNTVNTLLKDVNQIQTELDVELKPINLVKERLERAYEAVGLQANEELRRIEQALETLDTVLLMQQANGSDAVSTPNSSTSKRGPYKKRRTDARSTASPGPSTAPSPTAYPSSSTAGSPVGQPAPPLRSGTSKPGASVASGTTQPTASTVAGGTGSGGPRKVTSKNRKDALEGQLPLQPGRQVAFRQPSKAGPADQKKEEWILARIVQCIQGDKNRYAVEDVDYDPSNPTPEQGKYNTTLRSIVPLPDPRDKANTYPEQDYPKGTQVMAMYPDTTSFYRAEVQSGPGASTEKGKKKEKVFKVRFEDDDDNIRSVPIELVVEVPRA